MAGAGPDPRFTYSNIDRFPDGRIFNPTCLRNNPPMVARLVYSVKKAERPLVVTFSVPRHEVTVVPDSRVICSSPLSSSST